MLGSVAMRKSALIGLVLLAACGDDGGGNTSGIPDACNPLGGHGCMKPWPSATYMKTDSSSMTGFRLDIPIDAMPVNEDREPVDPSTFNRWDGFSLSGPMLVSFDEGVSATGLPPADNPDASLAATSPIVLLDMDRGTRAAFFAEIDQNTIDPLKRDLNIRPLVRLQPGTRYAVAITSGVKAADGSELAPSPGMKALLDGSDFGHPRFAEIQKRWPAIETALGAAGVATDDLVLAWDFVTASDEFMRSDLTTMRDAALPAIGQAGANLSFTISRTEPNDAQTFKRYLGTYKAPDFLTAGETDPSVLRRGADGLPVMDGMRDAQFAAIIPKCVETMPLPRPTVIFGHGLFGSAKEYLNDGFVKDLANEFCFVVIAGDFIGLSSRQLQLAPLAVNDMNRGTQISEKLAQSIIDFISLENVARGPMARAADFTYNGQSVIDPTKVHYLGGSLGGIMGNTLMAYDPNFTKGVLAVPGGVWSMLFERSAAWFALLGAAQGSYSDPAVYQLVVAILGMAMEPYDPITTAGHVTKDPLFGQPAKEILIWYAIGDCLVNNISTEMIVREMGIPVLSPTVKSPWGIPVEPGPLQSGVTIYDEHPTPLPPAGNKPPSEDNGTHSGVNRNPAVLRQVEQFLLFDQIVGTCKDGDEVVACDCAPDGGGVCD